MRTFNNTLKRPLLKTKTDRFQKLPEYFQIIGVVSTVFLLCLIFYLAFKDYTETQDPEIAAFKAARKAQQQQHLNHPNMKFLDKCHWTLSESKKYFPSSNGKQYLEKFMSLDDKQQLSKFQHNSYNNNFFPGVFCEGYWRETSSDQQNSVPLLPFPEQNSEPFCGQSEVIDMIRALEKSSVLVDNVDSGISNLRSHISNKEHPHHHHQGSKSNNNIQKYSSRGLSVSRLERDKVLSSSAEYFDVMTVVSQNPASSEETSNNFVCWTGDLESYYISKFNVRPSLEFIKYLVSRNYEE